MVFFGFQLPAIYINDVTHFLKGVKRNPHRKQKCHLPELRTGKPVDVVDKIIAVPEA